MSREPLAGVAGRLRVIPEVPCLLGLSGGADSVALLHLMLSRFRERGISLEAVHVNHGLRGREAEEDERFVRELCRDLGVPLTVYRIDLQGRKDENAAREARFRCFRQRMEETGAGGLLLAHHGDDLTETFLMRLIRGAGPEGLACMRPVDRSFGMTVYRPLLGLSRREIRDALSEAGIPWREDGSNGNPAYLRNRVRMELVPMLESFTPGAAERVRFTAELLAKDDEALEKQTERLYEETVRGRALDAERLRNEAEALRTRVLRKWWQAEGPALSERALNGKQTMALEALLHKERGQVNLPGNLHAERGKRYLHLTGFPEQPSPSVPWEAPETGWGGLTLAETPSEGAPGDGKRCQEVPAGFAGGCVLRGRQPGDWIRPFGGQGRRKLQDYLTDRGVDAPWRDHVALLCRDREVLLVAGVGAGDIPPWEGKQTSVRLVWRGVMPWMQSAEDGHGK